MKNLLPKSKKLSDVITYGFDSFFAKILYFVVPFVIYGLLYGLIPIDVQLSYPFLKLGLGLDVTIWGILSRIGSFLVYPLILAFVLLAFLNLTKGKKLVISKLISKAFSKFFGLFVFFVIQGVTLGLSLVVLLIFLPFASFKVLAIVLFIIFLLLGFYFVGKFLFVPYIYLDQDCSIGDAFKESWAMTKKIGWGVVFGKYLVLIGMYALVAYLLSFVGSLLSMIMIFSSGSEIMLQFQIIIQMMLMMPLIGFFTIMTGALYIAHREDLKNNENSGDVQGCFFYGCWISSGILLAGFVAMIAGFWFVIQRLSQMLLSEKSIELPTVEYSQEELVSAGLEFNDLQNALNNNLTGSYEFSANELNALVNGSTGSDLKDYFAFSIEDDVLYASFSVPVEVLETKRFKKKYISGNLGIKITTNPERFDRVSIEIVDGNLNGDEFASEFWEGFSKGLTKEFYSRSTETWNSDYENYDRINQIEYAEITGGNLVIRLK